ncbi:MAG: hypothetical protein Q9195_005053 [Heterodermia aff. obscurata]
MSDSTRPKANSIPPWQRVDVIEDGKQKGLHGQNPDSSSHAKTSEDDLPKQALKFLDHDEIKEASDERKIEFLEKKGLASDEIRRLLKVSRERDTKEAGHTDGVGEEPSEGSHVEPQVTRRKMPASSLTNSPQAEDSPPIITYPEFLLHSQKPPPLITATRLLTTFYAISGVAALAYSTGKFVVEPMIESLTSARHSFAERALGNLQTLNEKLEEVVSVSPCVPKSTPDSSAEDHDDVAASEFFHRSTATQTSPHLSRSNSSSSTSSLQQPSIIENQATRLERVREDLRDLIKHHEGNQPRDVGSQRNMKEELDDLQIFLSRLTYVGAYTDKSSQKNEDSIAKLKGEIRQTKGVLLSSRNFPSSTAARGWGVAPS